MKALKVAASRLLRNLVYHGGLSPVLCRLNRQSRILMLHGVGAPEFPTTAFRAQLAFLNRFFQIVSLDQIWRLDSRDSDTRPRLALTFDDGLRNNFSLAYPILRDLKAPATFFVCPGLIDSGRWLWNHECRARLAFLAAEERCRFGRNLGVASPDDIDALIQKLKNLPNAQRRRAEAQLGDATPDFTPTEQQHQKFDIMTWQELKALDPGLITIGGHSANHEILPLLDPDHLEREVADCRVWLERELGRPVHHFCYPDGAYNAQVLSCVGRHFSSAVTTKEGWVTSKSSLLELPRIAVPFNLPDLAWRMQHPTG